MAEREARTYPCDWASEIPRIKQLVEDTLNKLQMHKLKIPINWIESKNKYGRACCGRPGVVKNYLEFSITLWPYLPPEERDNTVIHEVCHVVDYELTPPEERAGIRRIKQGHTEQWERLMWLCGIEAERFGHDPIPAHVVDKRIVYCACRSHQVAQAKFASMLTRTRIYKCAKCKTPLSIQKPGGNRKIDIPMSDI